MHARRWAGDEQGETLLELVVSIVILGISVVAIASGISISIKVSDLHRKQATGDAYVRDYAEAISTAVDAAPSAYTACGGPSAYQSPAGFAVPSGYAASVTKVLYWNGSGWQTTCGADTGLQQLTLQVASTDIPADQKRAEVLTVVIRKPCRITDAIC